MSSQATGPANRLAKEPSPYLRQHAHNPVDWWPWGDAAFSEAKRRNVPVFLSIGYATCHWCHVMAHESFEDPDVARAMNAAFVNIKVDREERPDLDDLYMAVCQQLTGHGGWPLTVILTPDRKPFFAGTYFPKQSRHGRMGMLDLAPRITEAWTTGQSKLEAQAEHILQHVRGDPHEHGDGHAPVVAKAETADLGLETLTAGAEGLRQRYDKTHGGFRGAPKFPSPHQIWFLLRMAQRGDTQALAMASHTLEMMARGGIRDHLDGGFHRYSTDAEWHLPHFEKMLYDQATLALAYAEGFARTRNQVFADTARGILDYVLRDLQDPAGGFHSAEDADAEGEEGKFHVWSHQEVQTLLGKDADRFCRAYGIAPGGNFHDEATREPTALNVLHRADSIPRLAEQERIPLTDYAARLAAGRTKLFAARAKRVRPIKDDKVLTDWNGLAIAALSRAATTLGEARYLEAARKAASFLRTQMRQPNGRLRHRFRAGAKDEVSFLSDHAYLLWGLLELFEAGQDPAHLAWATEVAGQLQARFAAKEGGFHVAPHDGEALAARRKDAYDGALPSGNTTAAYALLRLGLLTGDPTWTETGETTLDAMSADMAAHPIAFTMGLVALDLAVGPTRELCIVGDGPEASAMMTEARKANDARLIVLRASPGLATAAPWTADMKAPAGQARAYLCVGHACKAPVATAAELRKLLAA